MGEENSPRGFIVIHYKLPFPPTTHIDNHLYLHSIYITMVLDQGEHSVVYSVKYSIHTTIKLSGKLVFYKILFGFHP